MTKKKREEKKKESETFPQYREEPKPTLIQQIQHLFKSKPKKDVIDEENPPTKKRFEDFFKNNESSAKKKIPITFNVGLAIMLFLTYLSVILVSLPSQPIVLVVAVPTLYLLVVFIRNERRRVESESY